jgi:3-oxoacyl-[acyl-carrier-protein] synthase-1
VKPRRVVVSGVGIISSIGHSYAEVLDSLQQGRSGIRTMPQWRELGFPSAVAGDLGDCAEKLKNSGIKKTQLAYASDAALFSVLAAKDAVDDAQLSETDLHSPRTGCIVGSGVSGLLAIYQGGDKVYQQQVKRVNPYTVCHAMSSSCSATLANIFGVKGRSYSISSACATSAHNIGHAYELIRDGALDLALAGGAEELNELIAGAFCAMRMALSSQYNDTPQQASRPYDQGRDGFVISGGAGILVLEDLRRAQARGAKIYGEVLGFGANSEGGSMVFPETEGEQTAQCMAMALECAGLPASAVDYINTHGTATQQGDLAEANGIRHLFGDKIPPLSSTKSMTGHAVGAAGAQEAIYCLGMLERQFLAPSINIDSLDPAFEGLPIIRQATPQAVNVVMSNSLGFGGTNAVLLLGKYRA